MYLKDPTKLVLVVHGVGSPAPGSTIQEFEASVAKVRQSTTSSRHERFVFAENEEGERQLKNRVAPVICQESEDDCIRIAEVNWTDLSLVGDSLASIIGGFFEVILFMFDARDAAVVDQARHRLNHKAGKWIKGLLHGSDSRVRLLAPSVHHRLFTP